jgi:hypothetical protein
VAQNPPLPKNPRRYPRSELRVKARLSVRGDTSRSLEATLPTTNISVGGIFLESTFFLKMGMAVDVELELPPHNRTVRARGTVVRVKPLTPNSRSTSGFAIKFLEFIDGTELLLANYFLAPVLREFLVKYARRHRFEASEEYLSHTADVLAAWELQRAETPDMPVWDRPPAQAARQEPSSSASSSRRK